MSSGGGGDAPEGAPEEYYDMLIRTGDFDTDLQRELANFYKYGSFNGQYSQVGGLSGDAVLNDSSLSDIIDRPYSQANMELAQVAANTEMVQPTLDLAKAQTALKTEATEAARPLLATYMAEAGNVDPNAWMNRAHAETAQQFDTARQQLNQQITRTGAAPGSGRMAALNADMTTQQAKATAGARNTARRAAEDARFTRLSDALNGVAA
jgi:uncharacterized protein YgiM (DUF1202 family)